MNTRQKELTYYAIAAFFLTLLFAAWDLTGSSTHINVTRYSPIFAPPELAHWTKRELASSTFWTWLGIGIIYVGLFFSFRTAPAGNSSSDKTAFAA